MTSMNRGDVGQRTMAGHEYAERWIMLHSPVWTGKL